MQGLGKYFLSDGCMKKRAIIRKERLHVSFVRFSMRFAMARREAERTMRLEERVPRASTWPMSGVWSSI